MKVEINSKSIVREQNDKCEKSANMEMLFALINFNALY